MALACTRKVPVVRLAGLIGPSREVSERERDDLLTTVERPRIEGEPNASAWLAVGIGGDAGHRQASGGRAGGQDGAAPDGLRHSDSNLTISVRTTGDSVYHGCICEWKAPESWSRPTVPVNEGGLLDHVGC